MCTAIHVFLIALMVQSGLAIKCFNCDTDTNEGCANMTDQSIKAEECDDAKQIELQEQFENRNRNFLQRISDIYYYRLRSKTYSVPMVCQKLVGTDEYRTRSVVRRCQLANVECDYSYAQLASKFSKDFQIESCEVCEDKDGCNGSSSYRAFGVLVGIAVVLVSLVRLLIM